VVEIDERVCRPQLLPELVARNDVAAARQQQQENVERAAAQSEDAPLLPELAGPSVGFKDPESIPAPDSGASSHKGDAVPRF
jgi:hypothetical protein